MDIQIFTRSINQELYDQAMNFVTLPYVKNRFAGTTSDNYFIRLFISDCDWAINIDEDCFVFDNNEVQSLLDYMIANDFDYCGMPDGGVVTTRGASPIVPNAFFNIFNVKKIREKLDINALIHSQYEKSMNDKIPMHLMHHSYSTDSNLEPYYKVFYWLLDNFKPLFLDARTIEDGITTELFSNTGTPFCWHTWYAHEYKNQKDRIDKVIKKCMIL